MARPYADRARIQSRSTRYLTETSVSADLLAKAQEFGDSRIDSRLCARFATPFDPVPDQIAEISADLAAYFVILDLWQNGRADAPVEYAQELERRAMVELRALAGDDMATLPAADLAEAAPPSAMRVRSARTSTLQNFDGVNPPSSPSWVRPWL